MFNMMQFECFFFVVVVVKYFQVGWHKLQLEPADMD